MQRLKKILKMIEWEALIWIGGLVYLFAINPYHSDHISICPYKNMGIDFCPGCGLGRAISYISHGDLINSFHAHPLAVPALIIIVFRIVQLIRKKYFVQQNQNEVIYG